MNDSHNAHEPDACQPGTSNVSNQAEEILPLVYDELRRLAHAKMSRESPDHTLQTTALVHEAFLKITRNRNGEWRSERDFVAAAAQAMRQILVDKAREKRRLRRGRGWMRIDTPNMDQFVDYDDDEDEVLGVDEALKALDATSPEKATLIKLRYFAGLSLEEAGQILGLSRASAYRQWSYARAILLQLMQDNPTERNKRPTQFVETLDNA